MTTLTDLRRTLEEHAARVDDGESVVRATAVRHRVGVVRRRRRVAGAGALALVAALVGGATFVTRGRGDALPSAPTVLGVRAPGTLRSLGYTYRVDGHTSTFSGSGSVRITAAAVPRLYSWTTDRAARVRMVLPNGEIWTSTATHFRDFVEIPAAQTGRLQVSVSRGRVGLASYALTDRAPDGVTKDGVTFRRVVAGTPLLGAIITDPGQTDATTSFVEPGGEVGVHLSCVGLPHGAIVHVSFNGSERTSGDCNDPNTFDPGTASGARFAGSHAGRTVSLRVWATRSQRSTRPLASGAAPRLRMFVGVYGPVPEAFVGGTRVPSVVEQDGHTWSLARVASHRHGDPVALRPVHDQMVAQLAWSTKGSTVVSFAAGRMPVAGGRFDGGQASIGDLWVPAGASVEARLVHGTGAIGVGLYRRTDGVGWCVACRTR